MGVVPKNRMCLHGAVGGLHCKCLTELEEVARIAGSNPGEEILPETRIRGMKLGADFQHRTERPAAQLVAHDALANARGYDPDRISLLLQASAVRWKSLAGGSP